MSERGRRTSAQPTPNVEQLIALGVVSKPHGVRGGLHVHLHNPESALLIEQEQVWLRKNDAVTLHRIVESKPLNKSVALQIADCQSRDAADAWRGAEVCVPRDTLPALDDDQFYIADLEGLPVWLQGKEIGRIERMLEYPTIRCLLVSTAEGNYEVPMSAPWLSTIKPEDGRIEILTLESLTPEPPRKNR